MALMVLATTDVHPRFFRIHWLIVLSLIGAAGMFAWDKGNDWFWFPLGLSFGLGVLGFWCWAVEELRFARWCVLGLALCALCGTLIFSSRMSWHAVDDLSGAGVLGLATTAMLMGHWYLISPTMSLTPLLRLIKALGAVLAVRAALAGVGLALTSASGTLDQTAWLWLLLRWGAGFVGPAILGWMAWESARIRSTQSATGILYVVVIFVFIGELTDQLLQAHLAEMTA